MKVLQTTKAGDLWQLGDHRLLCGDSTNESDVARLMETESIESVITDPPYGINYRSNHRKTRHRAISGDGSEKLLKMACSIQTMFSSYVFCRWDNLPQLPRKPDSFITWVKNNWSMGNLKHEHARQTESICFYSGSQHKWRDKRPTDIVFSPRTGNKLHPTQKPLLLIETLLEWCVGSIYDPFAGSGTTMMACEKNGRRCLSMEIDPTYCDVIVKRWQDLSGMFNTCKAINLGHP